MKFQVGEIAILAVAPKHPVYARLVHVGDEVEIVRVGLPAGSRPSGPVPQFFGLDTTTRKWMDYEIRLPSGHHAPCQENKLRKRRPPIPEEVLTIFQGKPVEVDA